MKNFKHIILLSTLGLALAACGNDSDVTVTEKSSAATSEQTSVVASSETTSKVGKRSNPVSLGEVATSDIRFFDDNGNEFDGNISLALSNVIRGEEAKTYLMDANEYNEDAPEGMEWIIIDIDFSLNSASTEDAPYYVATDFVVVASDGSQISQDVYPTVAEGEDFGFIDLYSGGSESGKYAFYAPIDDDILLEYDDLNNPGIFFSLK